MQDARIQRVLEFLKAPAQLSDKDLAAKVPVLHLPHASINRHFFRGSVMTYIVPLQLYNADGQVFACTCAH